MIVAIDVTSRVREEHRRVHARRASRLPVPRHGCDVPRAYLARAADGVALEDGRARGAGADHVVSFSADGKVAVDDEDVSS